MKRSPPGCNVGPVDPSFHQAANANLLKGGAFSLFIFIYLIVKKLSG